MKLIFIKNNPFYLIHAWRLSNILPGLPLPVCYTQLFTIGELTEAAERAKKYAEHLPKPPKMGWFRLWLIKKLEKI